MAIIQFDTDNKVFYYGGRDGSFTNDTKAIEKYVAQEEGWEKYDICHRISFYTMSIGIINALNYYCCFAFQDTEWEKMDYIKQTMSFLCGVILSVKGKEISDDLLQCYREFIEARQQEEEDFDEYLRRFNDGLCDYLYSDEQYGEYLKSFEAMLNAPADELDITGIISHAEAVINLLNNETGNLRPGNPSFNRSLGKAYDVQNMEYKNEKFKLTDSEDGVRIANLIRLTEGAETNIPGTQDALFFFMATGGEGAFVYGSTLNGLHFVSTGKLQEYEAPIVYDDYLTGEEEEIVFV